MRGLPEGVEVVGFGPKEGEYFLTSQGNISLLGRLPHYTQLGGYAILGTASGYVFEPIGDHLSIYYRARKAKKTITISFEAEHFDSFQSVWFKDERGCIYTVNELKSIQIEEK